MRGERTIVAAAAYRSGTRLQLPPRRAGTGAGSDGAAPAVERTHANYRQRRGVHARRILAPRGAPAWATDRQRLWLEVEQRETRPDALLAREFLLTLPLGVPLDAVSRAVGAWASRELVARGMVADLAVHRYGARLDTRRPEDRAHIEALARQGWPVVDAEAADAAARTGAPHVLRAGAHCAYVYQPHAHVLVTTRGLENGGFAKVKNRDWGRKAALHGWQDAYNRLLADHAIGERVDCRAGWRRRKDKTPPENLTAALEAAVQPPVRTLHLGEGTHPARRGRPPADPPTRPNRQRPDRPMKTPAEFNQALAVARGQPPTPAPVAVATTFANWQELHDLVAFAHALEARGVRFYAHPERRTLSYATPDGKALPEADYKRFRGKHEPVVLVLREEGTLCPDETTAKARAKAFAERGDAETRTAPSPVPQYRPQAQPAEAPPPAAASGGLIAKLAPLFRAARRGEELPDLGHDPELAWIVREYEQLATERRRLQAALWRMQRDATAVLLSFGRIAAGRAHWLRSLRERADTLVNGLRPKAAPWQREVAEPVYHDPADAPGIDLARASIKELGAEEIVRRIASCVDAYRNTTNRQEHDLLFGGLKILVPCLTKEQQQAVPEALWKKVTFIGAKHTNVAPPPARAQPTSGTRDPGGVGDGQRSSGARQPPPTRPPGRER